MHLNQPKIASLLPLTLWSMKKWSSRKPVPGAKKVRDCCH